MSTIQLGDSKLENELKIAEGFPNRALAHDEIMVPETFHRYFGFKESPEQAFSHNRKQLVDITFDLNELIQKDPKSDLSSGEQLLKRMGLPVDTTVSEFIAS